MTLFGTEKWLERGETFSVYFGMFSTPRSARGARRRARLPPGAVGARPGGSPSRRARSRWCWSRSAATDLRRRPEGALTEPIRTVRGLVRRPRARAARRAAGHQHDLPRALPRASSPASSGPGSTACTRSRTSSRTRELGRLFAHAFIPIALAYLVAHYFSLVVFQEQAQFTYLLSDPLGDGSDIFGTAGSGIDYGAISANAIWYVQVGALVVGHVTALVLGHDRALKVYGDAARRRPLAVLDAGADGRLHLARAVPALAVERLSPPSGSRASRVASTRRPTASAPVRAPRAPGNAVERDRRPLPLRRDPLPAPSTRASTS